MINLSESFKITSAFELVLFPFSCVKIYRRSYGYASKFCLGKGKNNLVILGELILKVSLKEHLALNYYFFTVLIVFSSLAFSPVYSQNPTAQIAALAAYADEVYGSDDALVNGSAYIPDHYNAKGNPYFLTDQWIEGTISKDGRKYENQDILFNIEKDHLILMTTPTRRRHLTPPHGVKISRF